jgi:hypothetical protein
LNFQQGFETIKDKFSVATVVQGPNWALQFHIHTNASNKFVGEILGQYENNKPYEIYFISKNSTGVELNYSVTKN